MLFHVLPPLGTVAPVRKSILIRGAEFLPALDFGSSLVMPSESLIAMNP